MSYAAKQGPKHDKIMAVNEIFVRFCVPVSGLNSGLARLPKQGEDILQVAALGGEFDR